MACEVVSEGEDIPNFLTLLVPLNDSIELMAAAGKRVIDDIYSAAGAFICPSY